MNVPGFTHAADAIVECKQCGASYGEPCIPQKKDKGKLLPGYVHFGRRVRRMMLTAKMPERREEIEQELIELLIKELKKKSKTARTSEKRDSLGFRPPLTQKEHRRLHERKKP